MDFTLWLSEGPLPRDTVITKTLTFGWRLIVCRRWHSNANYYQSSVNLHILAQKYLQINQKLPASGKWKRPNQIKPNTFFKKFIESSSKPSLMVFEIKFKFWTLMLMPIIKHHLVGLSIKCRHLTNIYWFFSVSSSSAHPKTLGHKHLMFFSFEAMIWKRKRYIFT